MSHESIVDARARVGLPTHEPQRKNRWRFVAIAGGGPVIVIPPWARGNRGQEARLELARKVASDADELRGCGQ